MKTASLVFFYFGEDSYVRRLAQETVQLHHALTGYDKRVLLRHQTKFGPFEVSERAEKKADVVDLPTRENLAKYLNELGDAGYVVDVYIFSHGSPKSFMVSKGTYGDSRMVNDYFLEHSIRPLKLRAVWQTNCYGSTLNPTWRKLGARVVTGSRHVNFYPTRFQGFIRRWLEGETFGRAVSRSDTKATHTPVQLFLLADAASQRNKWGGCPVGRTPLGTHDCAKRYFESCWSLGDMWRVGRSGKQNMNYASRMLFDGDRTVTKSTVW